MRLNKMTRRAINYDAPVTSISDPEITAFIKLDAVRAREGSSAVCTSEDCDQSSLSIVLINT